MENQKKEFTGVWIPREIIEDKSLSATDKIIYVEIASFRVCYMSNKVLGERAGCSEVTASVRVKNLIKKGYVKLIKFDGRRRFIKAIKDFEVKSIEIDVLEGIVGTEEIYSRKEVDLSKQEDRLINSLRQVYRNDKLDNNKDNNIDSSSEPTEVGIGSHEKNFNCKEVYNNWINGKNRMFSIIARMYLYKEVYFETNEQLQVAKQRHLKAAKKIVVFSENQIALAFEKMIANKNISEEWTLDTLLRYLVK